MKCFMKRRYNLWQTRKTRLNSVCRIVYWAKINEWGEDPDGNKTVPAYGPSKHLPGAVSLSIDANGEAENFLRTTAFIMSLTTMQDIQVTLKLPLSQQNLQLKS